MSLNRTWMAMAMAAVLFLPGCGKEKTWVVLDYTAANGGPVQIAFLHPTSPDISIADCQASLEAKLPELKVFAEAQPKLTNAKYERSACVRVSGDPIKPQPAQ